MMQLSRFILLFLCVSGSVFAQDISIIGSVEQMITLTQPNPNAVFDAQSNAKTSITLLKVELSEEAQRVISKQVENALQNNKLSMGADGLAAAKLKYKQLGMNSVPVLNQGKFGTCTTFAVTAAMDAMIDKGDYISQLCILQLGQNLAKTTGQSSGWSGANINLVLNRFKKYGLFSQENQKKYGCGGLKKYPESNIPSTDISPEAYAEHSESLDSKRITWRALLDKNQIISDKIDINERVNQVKQALNAGNRVTFGVLLPRTDLGTAGAVGWHHYLNDTWMLTTEISKEIESHKVLPGHAMVITGYDDNAVSMDHLGHRHRGLFTLRNSWGAYVADWGDFYMTYDYFKTLGLEAQQVTDTK